MPDYSSYMGLVFEKICRDYLLHENSLGELPILFTSIGRWRGTNPATREETEIDLIAQDGMNYLICECKWRNEKSGISVLEDLREKADIFNKKRDDTYYVLFSKSGFTSTLIAEALDDDKIILVLLDTLMEKI